MRENKVSTTFRFLKHCLAYFKYDTIYLYIWLTSIFIHNSLQSGHCAGGNKRSTLGHGSSDIPSHIAQVGIQEAKNVWGAAKQCAHAQGAAGETDRESETEIDIYYIYICALQNYERMNLADALVSKTYENGERIIKQGKLPL